MYPTDILPICITSTGTLPSQLQGTRFTITPIGRSGNGFHSNHSLELDGSGSGFRCSPVEHHVGEVKSVRCRAGVIVGYSPLSVCVCVTQSSGPLSQLANTDPAVFIFTEIARGRYLRE